jgi:hypothetical protein
MAKMQSAAIEQRSTMSIALEITGSAPIIQNCFSQKAIEEMLRKHMGLSVQREKKIPSECLDRATIRNTSGAVCIPPTAIKKAMLTAAAQIKGLKKTNLRTQIFIEGGSIPIAYSQMIPRMDMVRTSGVGRTPDVRFRPCFEDWSARLIIQFSEILPVQTVVDLLLRAGDVGIGEWRPEKDGTFGTFSVTRNITDPKEIDEIRKSCRPGLVALRIPEWAMNAELSPEILAKIGAGDGDEEEGTDKDSEETEK